MTPAPAPGSKKTPPPAGGAPAAPNTPPAPAPQPPLPEEPEYVPVGEESAPAPAPPAGEAWATYTQEDLNAAESEIANMKPTELLALRDRLSAMEKAIGENNPLGEAGGVAWMDLFSKMGAKISLTSRALNPTDALVGLVNAVKYAGATWGFQPISTHSPQSQGRAAPAQQAQSSAPAPVTTADGRTILQTGTGELHYIEVEDPKKDKPSVKFHVGKFKHPFSDARIRQENGAQIIAELFDADLGWTPEHFVGPVYYAKEQFGERLFADWEQVQKGDTKYWNVIRVHK